ncbi:hypothetical protein Acsp06_41550 [Actinomycetospora sp. NBRC 106375]|uniref:hypothetical protein n=1 Tax=Actinomycetospora sp. NBRC 106375 TaxID=3032207 RepID=UPI00249FCABF|nr:hypothetical protein [Actinomycetospora sp. NBRC 106375]GLZ47970.1 hypothetical protein Acsp06_41550 [Actinomycetospora sp. NBRC 106375]
MSTPGEHDDELRSGHGPVDGHGEPDGSEHDPTPPGGAPLGEDDPTLRERTTVPVGPQHGDMDADDDEIVWGVLHSFPAVTDGEEGAALVPCWHLIGLSRSELLALEAVGPTPSLTECGAHFHADLESP